MVLNKQPQQPTFTFLKLISTIAAQRRKAALTPTLVQPFFLSYVFASIIPNWHDVSSVRHYFYPAIALTSNG